MKDWRFAVNPGWMASHLFVAAMVGLCIVASLWQWDRLGAVQDRNTLIQSRADRPPAQLSELLDMAPDQLDFIPVADRGEWLDPDVVRISNRSQKGSGGQWVVGLFQTSSGIQVLVNRGFVTLDGVVEEPPESDGPNDLVNGWLQLSQLKTGFFGVSDTGSGPLAPRLDVAAISQRLDTTGLHTTELDIAEQVFPLWLQLSEPGSNSFPDPVPLPELSEGNHLSYAFQWAVFGIMTVVVYTLILRRRATADRRKAVADLVAEELVTPS